MISEIRQKLIPILSASLFVLAMLANAEGARAGQQPNFTIETLPADKGPIASEIWSVGTSIRIVEAMSLPNTCDGIEGEVNLKSNGTEVFVKLKPKGGEHLTEKGCTRKITPVVVSVTIPDMPFVPFCHHDITLETPQGIKKHGVTINW
jgi:hypothetical protein